jgi:hypothetical protein
MDQYQTIIELIALSAGVAWASGINLYAVLLVLGLGGSSGYITLPDPLLLVQNPAVIAAAGLMYMVEFTADKMPGVDTLWDGLHTFIRLPAGALLAAGALGEVEPSLLLAAAIVGGGISATSHAVKAGGRVLINTSPEPFSNWGASLAEDFIAIGGLWLALNYPVIFIALLATFIILSIWLLPKLWRAIKTVFKKIKIWLAGDSIQPVLPTATSSNDSLDTMLPNNNKP